MTIQEAIEQMDSLIENSEDFHSEKGDIWEQDIEALNMAKNALEKQIPKKPIDDRYPWCICPTCGGSVYLEKVQEHIQNNETTHCEHCGQALDWGDTNDT